MHYSMNITFILVIGLSFQVWNALAFHFTRSPLRIHNSIFSHTGSDFNVNPVRGARDFPPSELRKRSHVFDSWRNAARCFAFEEYDAPIVEHEELYTRKSGEEIAQQLYSFADKSGRRLAIRPELTPSLTRMILGNRANITLPIKWYSIPQCWRYENSARGRRREHYQWNMDIWGIAGPDAEAEVLAAAVMSLKQLGLTEQDIVIRISNRKLLTEIMTLIGIDPTLWSVVFVVIDKLDKIGVDEVLSQLVGLTIPEQQCRRLLDLMQIKTIDAMASALGLTTVTESPALNDLSTLFALLADYNLSGWVSFDPTTVRGLNYYTGTVFEAFDRAGQLRAVFGGGRYDNLVHTLDPTAEALSAVGFGMGDVVLLELLQMKGLIPDLSKPKFDSVVFAMETELKVKACKIAMGLREKGKSVDLILDEGRKLKWVLQRANRLGARELVVLAPDEDKKGEYLCKDLTTGVQTCVNYADNL